MAVSLPTPVAFIDRDGTLILEPEDYQIDAFEKLALVQDCIPALLQLKAHGWRFVMVSNQDGLGTEAYPQESFDGPHALLMQILSSQGIDFMEVLIDPSLPEDNSPNRKPGVGMMTELLKDRSIDWEKSVMIGDRETDRRFAQNLGIRDFILDTPEGAGSYTWPQIAHELVNAPRTARIERATKETTIVVEVDLDRTAPPQCDTGLKFFDHMLDQLGTHGGFALTVSCQGDLEIDEHHSIEDTGIAIGQAIRQALGDKRGIGRYGFCLPMDEVVAQAALDFSGRPYAVINLPLTKEYVGDLPTDMVAHFFESFAINGDLTLNLSSATTGDHPDNDHHLVESSFKALARALRQAIARSGTDLPSTKGML